MTYATEADMTSRFGAEEMLQLTDRSAPPTGALDSAVMSRALADADGLIDGHLGARYAVPLASPSADIVRIACDIARYLLHDLAAPEQVRAHYDDALRWLRDIAAGKLPLVGATGAITAARSTAYGPTVAAYSGTFGSDFASAWLPS